jgi:hypothetical protein
MTDYSFRDAWGVYPLFAVVVADGVVGVAGVGGHRDDGVDDDGALGFDGVVDALAAAIAAATPPPVRGVNVALVGVGIVVVDDVAVPLVDVFTGGGRPRFGAASDDEDDDDDGEVLLLLLLLLVFVDAV